VHLGNGVYVRSPLEYEIDRIHAESTSVRDLFRAFEGLHVSVSTIEVTVAEKLLIPHTRYAHVPSALGEVFWEKLPRRAGMTGSPQLYLSPRRSLLRGFYLGEPG
jgi:hypothetical protein